MVITTAHPKISFLRLVERSQLPDDFVADIESWRTRSGTVKVNFAVDRLPVFAAHPDYEPLTRGMRAALPHTDHLLAGNSIGSLEELARILEDL